MATRELFVSISMGRQDGALAAWQPSGNILAISGASDNEIQLVDRHGELQRSIECEDSISHIAWDASGDTLAIVPRASPHVLLWSASQKIVEYRTTGLPDVTLALWSKTSLLLALANNKGSLTLYDGTRRRRIPVSGKNPDHITCGAWSNSNKLVLGSVDGTITVSDESGELLLQHELKNRPSDLQFAMARGTLNAERHYTSAPVGVEENTVSGIMGGETLLLMDVADPLHPMELAFQESYGKLQKHIWFGDGFLALGFSLGYVVVCSTHRDEIGTEVFSDRIFDSVPKSSRSALYDIAISPKRHRLAVVGTKGIRVLDMLNGFAQIGHCTVRSRGHDYLCAATRRAEWNPDGYILTGATTSGHVYNYLLGAPLAYCFSGPCARLALQSSLREITVTSAAVPLGAHVELPESIVELSAPAGAGRTLFGEPFVLRGLVHEPEFIAVGPTHVAEGRNDSVAYFELIPPDAGDSPQPSARLHFQMDYPGVISDVKLCGSCAAVLAAGRIVVHTLLHPEQDGYRRKTLLAKDHLHESPLRGDDEGDDTASLYLQRTTQSSTAGSARDRYVRTQAPPNASAAALRAPSERCN